MLTQDELEKICKLARLRLEEHESGAFLQKLNGVFSWVKQLQDIDTSSACSNCSAEVLTERPDVVTDGNCRKDVLSNTDSKKFNMYSVPKVVE